MARAFAQRAPVRVVAAAWAVAACRRPPVGLILLKDELSGAVECAKCGLRLVRGSLGCAFAVGARQNRLVILPAQVAAERPAAVRAPRGRKIFVRGQTLVTLLQGATRACEGAPAFLARNTLTVPLRALGGGLERCGPPVSDGPGFDDRAASGIPAAGKHTGGNGHLSFGACGGTGTCAARSTWR